MVTGASTAKSLTSLSILPGIWPYFTQLDAFQVPAWLMPVAGGFTGQPRMTTQSLASLLACKLPWLQHLVVAVDALNQEEFFVSMQRMRALTSLDVLGGAPVMSKALQVTGGWDLQTTAASVRTVLLSARPSPAALNTG